MVVLCFFLTFQSAQRIDTLLSTLQPNVLQTFDNQLQAMFQGINANVGTKLEKAVKSEFKATVTPSEHFLSNFYFYAFLHTCIYYSGLTLSHPGFFFI